MELPSEAALLVIDMQKAIDHPSWGERNNPTAERNALALIQHWRSVGRPIFYIRHDSRFPDSTYRPGQPGHDFKDGFQPLPGETVIGKQNHSAFIGTDLDIRLRRADISTVVVCGVITNNSVEATVRTAENLGFDVYLAEDACFTFGKKDWNGTWRTADEVHAMSLANLSGEYATIVKTADLLSA